VHDLKKLRVAWNRAAPFVVTADYNSAVRQLDDLQLRARLGGGRRQLLLFDAAASAATGEL
jgi:hypothetical protein